jgi:hypothetical protein
MYSSCHSYHSTLKVNSMTVIGILITLTGITMYSRESYLQSRYLVMLWSAAAALDEGARAMVCRLGSELAPPITPLLVLPTPFSSCHPSALPSFVRALDNTGQAVGSVWVHLSGFSGYVCTMTSPHLTVNSPLCCTLSTYIPVT